VRRTSNGIEVTDLLSRRTGEVGRSTVSPVASSADEFLDIPGVAALRGAAHNRTPDHDTVGTPRRQRSDMISRGYTEAHTEGQDETTVKSDNPTPEILGQVRAYAGSPVPCDDVQESARGVRNRCGPRGRRGGRDELDHIYASASSASRTSGDPSRERSGTLAPSTPALAARSANVGNTHCEHRVMLCHEDRRNLPSFDGCAPRVRRRHADVSLHEARVAQPPGSRDRRRSDRRRGCRASNTSAPPGFAGRCRGIPSSGDRDRPPSSRQ